MKRRSIARRLILTVLLLEILSAAAVIALVVAYENYTHLNAFDVALQGRAASILGAVGDVDDVNDNVMLDWKQVNVPTDDMFQVVADGTNVLGQSASWRADLDLSPDDGLFTQKIGNREFRFLRARMVRTVDPGEPGGGKKHNIMVLYGASTDVVWQRIYARLWFYIFASTFMLIVSGLVIAWLLHRGMAPLRELASQAERVSATQWEFRASDTARSTSELAPVALAMESAVQRLQRSFTQQEQFLSDAAHELKTAVALVKSSIQVMTVRQRSSEEYAAGLERSLTDCERMEGIVMRMLALARIDASPDLQDMRSDLTECATRVIAEFSTMAELRLISLHIKSPGSLWTRLTPEECSLVCSNLLLNAIQHSPKGTAIRFDLSAMDGWIEVRVEDQGSGIPPEALGHVFERFYRGDPSRNRETGGSGLGLAICKAAVNKAGGEIRIESKVDAGTTVVIRVPRVEAPSA